MQCRIKDMVWHTDPAKKGTVPCNVVGIDGRIEGGVVFAVFGEKGALGALAWVDQN